MKVRSHILLLNIVLLWCAFMWGQIGYAQNGNGEKIRPLSSKIDVKNNHDLVTGKTTKAFYDSLKHRAYKKKFTKLLHKLFIKTPEVDKRPQNFNRLDYFQQFEGKVIGAISFISLDAFEGNVFNPNRPPKTWLERKGNDVHAKTKTKVIQKALLFKCGEHLIPITLHENERLIRDFPFIKDARFIVTPRSSNERIVDVTVITQDVFAYSVSVDLNGIPSGKYRISNNNVGGLGHEASVAMVTHNSKTPRYGFESFYSVRNVNGSFVDLRVGVLQNYKYKGYGFALDKNFLTPQTKMAGSVLTYRMDRTFQRTFDDPVKSKDPLAFDYTEAWLGRKFDIFGKDKPSLILAAKMEYQKFWERPQEIEQKKLFSNTLSFSGSIALSKWYHKQANLVYGFGSTEDIPGGYLAELIVGYDNNEFLKRWYTQGSVSFGQFLSERNNYLYGSFSFGGFFNKRHFQQGIIQSEWQYISRRFFLWRYKARQFFKLSYMAGLKRFQPEQLFLNTRDGIRGFTDKTSGTERCVLSSETVFFHNRDIYNFKFASFYYMDIGSIGETSVGWKNQNIFMGIGTGIRVRNESLVFNTIQIRLDYYPIRPEGMSAFGISIRGRVKPLFKTFSGRKPQPVQFK
ncbi:hypothetical protein EMN47_10050 [Prolixibacteraceae bacterium JC049]|nr:hypothetical protein [Prolixibacteraceae bacterium JC049]